MGRFVSIGLGPLLLGTAPLWLAGSAFAQATPEGAAALQQVGCGSRRRHAREVTPG